MATKNMRSGIYCITNKTNNKVYIGQSKDLTNRWRKHRYNLRTNIHTNSHLQSAFNIDGEDAFDFKILEECPQELRNEREIYWIDYYKSTDPQYGYNFQSGGCERQTIAEETKQKIIKSLTGRPCKEKTKEKIGNSNRGKKLSDEARRKMSEAKKGKTPWNKGIPITEEQKQQRSLSRTGKKLGPHSEETKRKISETQKGRTGWAKGTKKSEEWKRKIGEASKKMWAERRLNKK